jgi:D-xylulose reductase
MFTVASLSIGSLRRTFSISFPTILALPRQFYWSQTAVAVHAARLAKIKYGQNVVIMGSGTVGLLCGAVSKAFGAERVIMVDISKEKLDFAKTFLDCETFLTDLNTTGEVTAVSILETFGILGGVDAVIEASGAELSVHTGIFVLKSGGSYVQTGIGKPKIEFPILALSEKELRIRGCFRYSSGDYVLALTLFSQGHIKHRELISSISPFEDAILAWEKTGKGQGIKNLIEGVRDV